MTNVLDALSELQVVALTLWGLRPCWVRAIGTMRLDRPNGRRGLFAALQSCAQRLVVNAIRASQFLGREANAVHQVLRRSRARVQGLRSLVRPSAIGRLVVPGWVNPVQRISLWRTAHISQECSVVAAPRIAHDDTLASVGPIPPVRRVVAARLGIFPRAVLLRSVTVAARCGVAVRSESLCSERRNSTTATAGAASFQSRRLQASLRAAVASAKPEQFAAVPHKSKDYPSTESAIGWGFCLTGH
jgi:hypothetical protein